ncbi:deoxyribodipyrimidine photolyase [Frondihabitans sp. PAMC 28766]|uniref:cryptochrome/photolyase family protein n=1 Tax=Frondihabitans sp. PAMC 28766 TaxID=1795630 RepID=UPI00078D6C69|nr:deoxyribodipyrimidine photo-lyase [Frondihabitans sp. PAMC 28766]AMM21898.1 deoxyribodipyrimidine photolyase [Frondihabitans sp. PAMC 28766]
MTSPSLVWLRDDLRLGDNPALHAALERDEPVVVLYVLEDDSDGLRPLGAASKWWLHQSLTALDADLRERGGSLTLRHGSSKKVVPTLARELGAGAVFWNRRYGRAARDLDTEIKSTLHDAGFDAHSFQGSLLFEPWTIQTGSGTPFKVFTPFYRACLDQQEPRHPHPKPRHVPGPRSAPDSDDLASWGLEPAKPDWAGGLRDRWEPGEAAAHRVLEEFVHSDLADYGDRDLPADDTTSHLSPYLRWGEISPFQVWHRLRGDLPPAAKKLTAAFRRQLVWREFNYTVLFANPDLATANYRPEFDDFPWAKPHVRDLEAWQQGRTGIPLVDAGMRELWQTGVMHNRVRMVVGSFLIKNLLIDWRVGEQWFWDTLVDADEANNPGNWQWVAGSGADATPYFRVFNPLLQADKFDKQREYVTQWVAEVDTEDYPEPIVDLKQSRQEALAAYDTMRTKAGLK